VDKNTAVHCNAAFLSIAVASGYFWLHVVLVSFGLLVVAALSFLAGA
jgi:hypothetical protein